jgi:arylformamidase
MSLIDITPTVSPALAVWPGDTPLRREVLLEMRRGDNLTLSTLHGTVHLGAHADAPSHYGEDAESIIKGIDVRPYPDVCVSSQSPRLSASWLLRRTHCPRIEAHPIYPL